MEKVKLNRLSELTAIARKRELTAEEKSEREALRNEYRRSVIANLTGQLEATTIIEPDGSRIKVSDMKRSVSGLNIISEKGNPKNCFYCFIKIKTGFQ